MSFILFLIDHDLISVAFVFQTTFSNKVNSATAFNFSSTAISKMVTVVGSTTNMITSTGSESMELTMS